jgi:hypothetical protein
MLHARIETVKESVEANISTDQRGTSTRPNPYLDMMGPRSTKQRQAEESCWSIPL